MRILSTLAAVVTGALAVKGSTDVAPALTPQQQLDLLTAVTTACGLKDSRNPEIHQEIQGLSGPARQFCSLDAATQDQVNDVHCDQKLAEIDRLVKEFEQNIENCETAKKAAGVYGTTPK